MKPLPPYTPGQKRLSTEVENARTAELKALAAQQWEGADFSGAGGTYTGTIPRVPGGFLIRLDSEGSGGTAGQYAWTEMQLLPDGTDAVLAGGRTGVLTPTVCDPARELGGATGLIVAGVTRGWMLPEIAPAPSATAGEVDRNWRFAAGRGGGAGGGKYAKITAVDTTGVPVYTAAGYKLGPTGGTWVADGNTYTPCYTSPFNPLAPVGQWVTVVGPDAAGRYWFEFDPAPWLARTTTEATGGVLAYTYSVEEVILTTDGTWVHPPGGRVGSANTGTRLAVGDIGVMSPSVDGRSGYNGGFAAAGYYFQVVAPAGRPANLTGPGAAYATYLSGILTGVAQDIVGPKTFTDAPLFKVGTSSYGAHTVSIVGTGGALTLYASTLSDRSDAAAWATFGPSQVVLGGGPYYTELLVKGLVTGAVLRSGTGAYSTTLSASSTGISLDYADNSSFPGSGYNVLYHDRGVASGGAASTTTFAGNVNVPAGAG